MATPKPRCYRGFRDTFAEDLLLKQELIDVVRQVYERYGFLPLETPAVEFTDVLGKFLPESDEPSGGVFSFRNPDLKKVLPENEADLWLTLRYDLSAPLARVVAQHAALHKPYRRYQLGTVWRHEKPGPGRFREFTQFDFDLVGSAAMAADAECCCVIADVFEALGYSPGEYLVLVNDRKVLLGVLETIGVADLDFTQEGGQALAVLRSIDKLDQLGLAGVRELLGAGRKDQTGDFTKGAGLSAGQIEQLEKYLAIKAEQRSDVCDQLEQFVGASTVGQEGVTELREIDELLNLSGYGADQVLFDPTIVRGLGYYTGPVFEGVLTKEAAKNKKQQQFGSLFGGGRYDNLVARFTGEPVPATGASIGLDRLIEAMRASRRETSRRSTADVLVVVIESERMGDYFRLTREIRDAGINTELYLGKMRIGGQLKYADKLDIPLAVIAGGDEFAANTCQIKDLRLGRELAGQVESRAEWRKSHPAQQTVPRAELVSKLQELLKTD